MPRKSKQDPKQELNKYLKSEEYDKYIKLLKKIDVKNVSNPFETLSSKNIPKLKTDTVLDELLGTAQDGIMGGKLIELYGGYGSGKTQTILSLIAEASQEGTVILIDTEYTWEPERQIAVCEARGLNVEKMMENFILVQPADYQEQLAKLLTLPSPIDLETAGKPPLKLLAVDSLVVLIDDSRDFRGRQHLPARAGVIRDMLRAMRVAIRDHKCVGIFTNQVSSNVDVSKFTPAHKKEIGVGGNVVRHRPDIILYFRRTSDPYRIARLMDSSGLAPAERVFQINAKGVDDIEDEKKPKWVKKLESEHEKEEELETTIDADELDEDDINPDDVDDVVEE